MKTRSTGSMWKASLKLIPQVRHKVRCLVSEEPENEFSLPMPKIFLELQRRNTFSDSEVETLFFFVTTSIVSELSNQSKRRQHIKIHVPGRIRNIMSRTSSQQKFHLYFPVNIGVGI